MQRGIGSVRWLVILVLVLGAGPAWSVSGDDKKKEQLSGRPALWKDPGDVASRDLYWGNGSRERAPQPPFRFVKEDTSGTNPKIHVLDAAGVKWNVKFDEEVHAEVAASRIAHALGYLVEESYFVPSGIVDGTKGLGRTRKFIRPDGSFVNARFEKRPEGVVRHDLRWSWDSNPFVGTKELSGLILLNTMLGNWDSRDANNGVLTVPGPDGSPEDWYIVADWGGTFGKMGGVFSRSKWDAKDFAKQEFIRGVSGDRLELNYTGGGGSAMKAVPLDHARWFAGLVGQLSDQQLRDAFRAAGASRHESEEFIRHLRARIAALQRAVGTGSGNIGRA